MGQLVAEYGGEPINNGTRYLTADHLGSTRVVTDSTGNVKERHDYLPFGEEIGSDGINVSGRASVGQQDYKIGDTRQKFSGKERDVETGLDYFNERYYGNTLGRFTSADRFNPIVYMKKKEEFKAYLLQPQNWNRYVYCINNPIINIDPREEETNTFFGGAFFIGHRWR